MDEAAADAEQVYLGLGQLLSQLLVVASLRSLVRPRALIHSHMAEAAYDARCKAPMTSLFLVGIQAEARRPESRGGNVCLERGSLEER